MVAPLNDPLELLAASLDVEAKGAAVGLAVRAESECRSQDADHRRPFGHGSDSRGWAVRALLPRACRAWSRARLRCRVGETWDWLRRPAWRGNGHRAEFPGHDLLHGTHLTASEPVTC